MSVRQTYFQRYGPWAVVTGASSGIGRAIATELAQRGLSVVLVGRRQKALSDLGAEFQSRFGTDTRALAIDLADAKGSEALFAATDTLDTGLLVAAAGFGTSGRFLSADINNEIEMLHVNCLTALRQCRHFGERFLRRGRGGIVLMGSLLGFQGVPGSANYAATKAYIQTLAEGLRAELKGSGVDILSSAPGPVRSGFETRAGMRMTFGESPASVAAGTLDALGRRTTAIPGALSKLLNYSLAPLNRSMRTFVLGRVMSDMTRHQTR